MRSLRAWFAAQPRRELQLYVALTLVALALRLYDLGDRPFHHDESQDAYFSWRLFTAFDYEYDPLLHGPLRFYLTTLMYALFGASDLTARLAPALMGTAMVPMCWALRSLIGRVGALAVAVALTAGPSYLYFSRFAREDIYFAALSFALLLLALRFLQRPTRWGPPALGAVLAALFAVKESAFITVFAGGSFFLLWLASRHRRLLLDKLAAVGRDTWIWCVVAFLAIYIVLFTTFLTQPDHWDGLAEGLTYWLGQHDVRRGGESGGFYLVLLAGVELGGVMLGLVGAVLALRSPTVPRLFFLWTFLVSLAVYSWAGEKFAWLILHPLLPLLLLAGVAVQSIWDSRDRTSGRLGFVLIAAALLSAAWNSWTVNAEYRADPRELLVSTQSSEEVLEVRDRVLQIARDVERRTGEEIELQIDSSDGATFPWAWYFRDLPATYTDLSAPDAKLPDSDVAIVTDDTYRRLFSELDGYEVTSFPFRVWWVRDYSTLTPATALDYLIERRAWNATGGMREWLLVRKAKRDPG